MCLDSIRHGLAQILAQAVQELRPGAKAGFVQLSEDGFHFDFISPEPVGEADLPALEKEMRRILREGSSNPGAVPMPADGFTLRAVAGAYWQGDSQNPMMTRISAWVFQDRQELEARIAAHEAAQARDHKKLGRELELFVIDEEVGRGLPLWLPNGTVIRDELEKLMRELEFKGSYQRVCTPHLAKAALYRRTGHLPYFASSMYPLMEADDESYALRPMNCPHHHRIFAARKRSYRELPLRLAEHGQVYRFEDSGALSGLLRVRGMCQNDAHIYCSEEQLASELAAVLELHRVAYQILGLSEFRVRLSTHDRCDPKRGEKFIDDPEGWARAESVLQAALEAAGMPYFEGRGEAAFYGPKIDFQFRSVLGREETASTLQLDFGMARRLGLVYTGSDNREHYPFILHRAPLGTHERFTAFLIERYGGAFPDWLAPVQVRVVPVSERFEPYAGSVVHALRDRMVRAELDLSPDTLGKKIRAAELEKVPSVLVVGSREEASGSVTLRRGGRQEAMPLEAFQVWIEAQVAERRPR